jgi:hypothetical protein
MWVRLFHYFDFHHVRQITCEYRVQANGTSLTNTRREDFYRTMKVIHARYRQWAMRHPEIRRAQKKQRFHLAKELFQGGKPVDSWHTFRYAVELKWIPSRRLGSAAAQGHLKAAG